MRRYILKMMKKVPALFILLFTALLFTLPVVTSAQDEDGPDGSGDPTATDIPFDGGVSILVAFGIGFGIKKMRKDANAVEFPLES